MSSIYAIVPLLSAVFVLCLGLFICSRYLKTRHESLLVLSLFCLSVTMWLFGTFMMFLSKTDQQVIFWDKFVYAGVVFIPALMHHFSIIFTDAKNQRRFLILGYLVSLAFFLLNFTDLFVSDIFKYRWGSHTKAQFFHHFFIVEFFAYTSVFFVNTWRYYQKTTSKEIKNQAKYVFAAFLTLILVGAPAYLPAYGIGVPPFPFLSGLIFITILSYAMLRHKLLDVKAASAVFFTFALLIVFFVDMFLTRSRTELIFRVIAFLVMALVGYFLMRNVQHEIEQREKIEKLADDLESANSHLKEIDKVKDDFLSMASHELNTPIAAIEGYLSMILVEKLAGEIPAKAREYLDSVYSSAQRLARLVKDLLNVSRIESNRIHLVYEQKPIEDIITQAVTEVMSKAREAKHALTFEKPDKKMPLTWYDASRITEIVINMLGNAIKYTDPGGKITARVMNDDDKLVISVQDNGRGIPKDRQHVIFEKFTQADVLKDQQKGTGLGMFISKKFVELHKGKIWFHSDGGGKGTTFYFSLPIITKKPLDPHEGEGLVLH